MSVIADIYRGESRFDFVAIGRRMLKVSVALVVASVLMMVVRPFNLAIDFTGGTIVTAPNTAGASVEQIRSALRDTGQAGATIQITGGGAVLVRTEALDAHDQDALVAAVSEVTGSANDEINVDAVGPTFGAEVTRRAVQALVVFLIAVAVFITWRFEWKMAMAALVSVFHDLLLTAGIYAAVGFVVTPETVIAVLSILGYSLYDTVIVFDKVSETVHQQHARATYDEIVNASANQVLMRSINTTLTSVLPVAALLFLGSLLFGAETLQEFALALTIGMGVGAYSSMFVAIPLLARWKEGEAEWQRARVRAARRRGDGEGGVVPAPLQPEAPGSVAEVKARPPKQRRKRR